MNPFRSSFVLHSSGKHVIVFCLVCFLMLFSVVHVNGQNMNCTSFIPAYQERIIGIATPTDPITGISLKVCQQHNGGGNSGNSQKTCCTNDLEDRLRELGKADYEKAVRKILTNFSKTLKSKATKFNEFFKELLTKSKRDFHEMFKRTYGIVYEQNSYVFSNFFLELEAYFSQGKTNFADVMDNFFAILYQKMFTVINSQYKFDEKYLVCVSEHMSELKPFGDVPQKLSLPLKRSFIAARTYSQSLNVAGDIVANLVNILPTENCLAAVTKMMHCQICAGMVAVKVCNNFCLNVMKGCLAYHAEVDVEWNNFVDAMGKVEQRLIGPFNIELVVEPMNVKISEAIMNFQENAMQVSSKVFSGCGKPLLLERRRKRQTSDNGFSESDQFGSDHDDDNDGGDDDDIEEEPEVVTKKTKKKEGGRNKKKQKVKDDYDLDQYSSSPVYGFLKFIRETGSYVSSTRNYWKRLPNHLCGEEVNVETNGNTTCWTGGDFGRYQVEVVADGFKNQQQNLEVPVDVKKPNSLLNEQVFALKTVTSQLRNAFNGMDVEFIDMEEMYDPAGGGSGSGYGPENEDDSEEEYGSGDSPLSNLPPIILNNNRNISSTTVISISSESIEDEVSSVSSGIPVSSTSIPFSSSSTVSSANNESNVINVVNVNNNDLLENRIGRFGSVVRNNTSSTPSHYSAVSLNRAIASYLLPAVVIWIGGSFNEWFNSLL